MGHRQGPLLMAPEDITNTIQSHLIQTMVPGNSAGAGDHCGLPRVTHVPPHNPLPGERNLALSDSLQGFAQGSYS